MCAITLRLMICDIVLLYVFFSSRRRHTRWPRDWSSDVCSSDLQITKGIDHEGALRESGPRFDVRTPETNTPLLREIQLEIAADRESLIPVPVADPDIIIIADRSEITDCIGPTPCADIVTLQEAITEDRAIPLGPCMFVRVVTDHSARIAGVRHISKSSPALRVPHPISPETSANIELRCSGLPTLRNDLDDPVRGLRAIERCRCRALDDLDTLDISWIDIVEPAHIRTTALARTAPRITVHPDTIDIDDRLICERETTIATDPDRRTRPHLPGTRHHHHPWTPLGEELVDILDRRLFSYAPYIDRFDDVTDRAPLRATGRTGNDQLVEGEDLLREFEGQAEIGRAARR